MTADLDALERLARSATGLHEKIVADVPELQRGLVWCRACRRERKVDSADCLRNGWPKCCGGTMTINHPNTWEPPL